MSYKIICPEWGELKKYECAELKKDAKIFHFRVNYYPFYIAHLVNDNNNAYAAVLKFFNQWRQIKFEGEPLDTHFQDPPANITAIIKIAFDDYQKDKYNVSPGVKQQINLFIGVIKKWKAYKKSLKPVEKVLRQIQEKS